MTEQNQTPLTDEVATRAARLAVLLHNRQTDQTPQQNADNESEYTELVATMKANGELVPEDNVGDPTVEDEHETPVAAQAEVLPVATASIHLSTILVNLRQGDTREVFRFYVDSLPNSRAQIVKEGEGDRWAIRFETALHIDQNTTTVEGTRSTILQELATLAVRLHVSVTGELGADLDTSRLDASEPKVVRVTDEHGQIRALDHGPGSDVSKLFVGSFVGAMSAILKADPIEQEELHRAEEAAPVVPAKKFKGALSIPAYQRFMQFADWTPVMHDRAVVDDPTRLDPNWLQILPVVTIKDNYGAIFSYSRGAGGDEKQLHHLRSVHLGGHMDDPEAAKLPVLEAIALEAIREVEEETGWKPSIEEMTEALKHAFFIYAPKRPVDTVHLAVAITLHVPDRRLLTKLEEGVIEDPMWLTPEVCHLQMSSALFLKPDALAWTFETWAQVYLAVTSTPEAESQYRKAWEHASFRFRRMKIIVDLFEAKAPRESSMAWCRVVPGLHPTLQISQDAGETWSRFDVPLEGLINELNIDWFVSAEGAKGVASQFHFVNSIAGKVASTRDFINWTESVQTDEDRHPAMAGTPAAETPPAADPAPETPTA